jgi:hypothetical protein
MPARRVKTDPEIVEMQTRTMAVVHTVGDPNEVGGQAFKALYGAAYTLKSDLKKHGVDFKVEPPRARWFGGEDWANTPREQWQAAWALPLPDGTADVPQKAPETPVDVETWDYGCCAQILHLGTYAEEVPSIERLHAFIAEQGYEIAGPHEEEYLSRPDARQPKTLVRYQVRPRSAAQE